MDTRSTNNGRNFLTSASKSAKKLLNRVTYAFGMSVGRLKLPSDEEKEELFCNSMHSKDSYEKLRCQYNSSVSVQY